MYFECLIIRIGRRINTTLEIHAIEMLLPTDTVNNIWNEKTWKYLKISDICDKIGGSQTSYGNMFVAQNYPHTHKFNNNQLVSNKPQYVGRVRQPRDRFVTTILRRWVLITNCGYVAEASTFNSYSTLFWIGQ